MPHHQLCCLISIYVSLAVSVLHLNKFTTETMYVNECTELYAQIDQCGFENLLLPCLQIRAMCPFCGKLHVTVDPVL